MDADQLKKEADELLAKRGIHDILSKYGEVTYVGSYALDLMVWKDIDLEIQMKSLHSIIDFMDLAKDLAVLDGIKRINFLRDIYKKYPALPKGLCMGIYIDDWKIDVWDMNADEIAHHREQRDAFQRKLTKTLRELIFSFKESVLTEIGRTPKFSGVHIMQAILDHGLRDRQEIIEYLRKQGIKL